MSAVEITVEVGRLVCGTVRQVCERVRFSHGHHSLEWWESSGWVRRTFVIKGSVAAVAEALRLLKTAGFKAEI